MITIEQKNRLMQSAKDSGAFDVYVHETPARPINTWLLTEFGIKSYMELVDALENNRGAAIRFVLLKCPVKLELEQVAHYFRTNQLTEIAMHKGRLIKLGLLERGDTAE